MLEGKNNWKAWLYLLPALVLLGIFSFYPIIKSFIIAFIRNYDSIPSAFAVQRAQDKAAGLSYFTFQNFIAVVKDVSFSYAVKNTLLIAFVSVPSSVIISLVISVFLHSIKKLKGFFQTLYFLPYVTSAMAVSMAFTVLFANPGDKANGYSMGPVNSVVEVVGLKKPLMKSFDRSYWRTNGKQEWYNYICVESDGVTTKEAELQQKYDVEKALAGEPLFPGQKTFEYDTPKEYQEQVLMANTEYKYQCEHHFESLGYIDWVGAQATWNTLIFVVLMYSIWAGLAFKILVFTGGLTSIDKQYYDAAKIDATSRWRTFWRITVPLMSPLIVYILITSLIGSFKTYTSIVGLFGDGMAGGVMMTFVGLVYKYRSSSSLMGQAAAAAVTLFLIILVVTQITNRFTKKRVHY